MTLGFRTDLYQGTAPFYDRYRPPYPRQLFDDLRRRLPISGSGRLLDLACGTGQVAIPLARNFAEVVAVDQEPEFVAYGRAKAQPGGVGSIGWVAAAAESVAIDGSFELITVGNAFHRVNRPLVAERMLSWLQPGGGVALIWGDGPARGHQPWQEAMAELLADWTARAGATARVPADWAELIQRVPHEQVLRRAGLEYVGKFEFCARQTWTLRTLAGYAYSTSVLSRKVLGGMASAFERDLAARLAPLGCDGAFSAPARYAYELARKPGRVTASARTPGW